MDKIGLEGVGSRRRNGSESAAEISRMRICAEVGWSIWREQVTGLAERILLRISMWVERTRISNEKRLPRNARNTRKLAPISVNICGICGEDISVGRSVGSVCSVGIDVLPQMARIDTDG